MKDTTLLHILRRLPTSEHQRLTLWLDSPIINKNVKRRRLLAYLLRYAPDFDHPALAAERVYRHVFGKQAYQASPLHNVTSDTLQLVYQYLAFAERQYHPINSRLDLMRALQRRALHHPLGRTMRSFDKQLQQNERRDEAHYLSQYHYQHLLDQAHLHQSSREYSPYLQAQNDALDQFFLVAKLKLACDMMSRHLVVQGNYTPTLLPGIVQHLAQHPDLLAAHPAIHIYFLIYQTLTQPDHPAHYQAAKATLAQELHRFEASELRTLYDYLRNYCIRKINSGHTDYYREILTLYQFLLDRAIIFVDNQLSEWDYKNIVTVGVRLGELDWTHRFIHDYKDRLPLALRDNAFAYNLAAFHFESGDYRSALLQLHEVRFTDSSYYIGARIIQLKSYYLLHETEALLALIDAFKIYLLRNDSLSDYRKKANANFLRLALKLHKLREATLYESATALKARHEKFRAMLQRTEPLINKDWLEEQCQALDLS